MGVDALLLVALLVVPVGTALAILAWLAARDAVPDARATPAPANRHLQFTARRCQTCGYDLWATPQRCPECGSVPAWTPSPADEDAPAGVAPDQSSNGTDPPLPR